MRRHTILQKKAIVPSRFTIPAHNMAYKNAYDRFAGTLFMDLLARRYECSYALSTSYPVPVAHLFVPGIECCVEIFADQQLRCFHDWSIISILGLHAEQLILPTAIKQNLEAVEVKLIIIGRRLQEGDCNQRINIKRQHGWRTTTLR